MAQRGSPQDLSIVDDVSGVEPYATRGEVAAADKSQTVDYDPVAQTITWGNIDFSDGGPSKQTLYIKYVVKPDVYGPVIVNRIDSPHCVKDLCTTENPTPSWGIQKTSWPDSGTVVQPGDEIIYYLYAHNTSYADAMVTGAIAVDDLSGVLSYADIDELGPGLTLVGDQLSWAIPDMPLRSSDALVWFTVIVNENVLGQVVHNVVTPTTPGGFCQARSVEFAPSEGDPCVTDHRGVNVDLVLEKTAVGGPVASNGGDKIAYTVTVSNKGKHSTRDPIMTDTLPPGVTLSGAVTVVTTPPGYEADWTIDTSVPGVITASYYGWFGPADTATFTFTGVVGNLAHPAPAVVPSELINSACVAGFRVDRGPDIEVATADLRADASSFDLVPDWDTNPADNCDSASTPVTKPVPAVPTKPAALPSTGPATGWMLPLAASTILLGGLALLLSSRRREGVNGN